MAFERMEDCIHLKACRRLQAIARNRQVIIPRYCTESCTAYVSGKSGYYLTAEEACNTARIRYDGDRDSYDVYCPWDFQAMSLGEIVSELQRDEVDE